MISAELQRRFSIKNRQAETQQPALVVALTFLMQTFLPYADFAKSADALDNKRLGKQRVEAKQIYLALTVPTYGWKNHPTVKMWRGHEGRLLCYGVVICAEWRKRGFNDTLLEFFHKTIFDNFTDLALNKNVYPAWFNNHAFHRSHQSNLIRKNPDHYRPLFGPDVPDNLPYIWPV